RGGLEARDLPPVLLVVGAAERVPDLGENGVEDGGVVLAQVAECGFLLRGRPDLVGIGDPDREEPAGPPLGLLRGRTEPLPPALRLDRVRLVISLELCGRLLVDLPVDLGERGVGRRSEPLPHQPPHAVEGLGHVRDHLPGLFLGHRRLGGTCPVSGGPPKPGLSGPALVGVPVLQLAEQVVGHGAAPTRVGRWGRRYPTARPDGSGVAVLLVAQVWRPVLLARTGLETCATETARLRLSRRPPRRPFSGRVRGRWPAARPARWSRSRTTPRCSRCGIRPPPCPGRSRPGASRSGSGRRSPAWPGRRCPRGSRPAWR